MPHIKTDGKQSIPTVHMLTHTRNFFPTYFYSNDKMVVQVTKRRIILCWMMFHWTKMKNDLIFGFYTSKQLESTLFQQFIWAHTLETNLYPTLQQWQKHGSSIKNTYYFMFDDVPLNKNEKWFIIWIQHIKTVGKHSTLTNHMIAYTRNKFITNFTTVTKWWFK